MLNLVMLAAESLPAGGRVALAGHPEREIVITIDGARGAWPDGFDTILRDEQAAWRAMGDPRTLLGPLVVLLARGQGARLSFLPAATAAPPPLLVALA